MSNLSYQLHASQIEADRRANGQFGNHDRTAPATTLVATEDTDEARALRDLAATMPGHPEFTERMREHIERHPNTWKPDLVFIDYDEKLDAEHLDA